MQRPSQQGLREIATNDSREASILGQYWNAVEKLIGHDDSSALGKLRRRTVKDSAGRQVRLLFNVEELKRQASAGVLRFEDIYGRRV